MEPITKNDSDITEVAKDVLETMIALLGVAASVVPQANPVALEEEEASSVILDIKGDDLGILIGRRGQTLACLQYRRRLIDNNPDGLTFQNHSTTQPYTHSPKSPHLCHSRYHRRKGQ